MVCTGIEMGGRERKSGKEAGQGGMQQIRWPRITNKDQTERGQTCRATKGRS